MPYLVDSLPHSRNQFYLMNATRMIATEIAQACPDARPPSEVSDGWIVEAEDGTSQIRKKLEAVQTYWRENRRRHHQWWRVWSAKCTDCSVSER